MAKRTTLYTLDAKTAAALPGIIRKVNGEATSTVINPYRKGKVDCTDLWLELIDSDGAPYEQKYTVRVWNAPVGGAKVYDDTASIYAFNMSELGDGPTSIGGETSGPYNRSGYTLLPESMATCGKYYDMDPVPTYRRHKALGYEYRDGTPHSPAAATSVGEGWYFVFDFRADPTVKLSD